MTVKKITALVLPTTIIFVLYWQLLIDFNQAITLSITAITAVLWVTEWLPIPVTSLLPLALFPLMGVLTPTAVAQAYGSPLIILMLGGFLLSSAMAHSNTHKYLANKILITIGTDSPRKVILGFMITAFSLSMWISNTATTLMLLPIAVATISYCNDQRFTVMLLLGIAYAASIGGTLTPIGTPPNLIMIQNYQQGTQIEIGFAQWMVHVAPMVLILFPLMTLIFIKQVSNNIQFDSSIKIKSKPLNTAQKRTLIVFSVTALLWITRTVPMGGWKNGLKLEHANDASVALLGAVALFVIGNGKGGKLLTWHTANRIPWGVLLLFAGGIVIAAAFQANGLSALLAEQLMFLKELHVFFVILVICLSITFLTEITSNTATTAIIMPILFSASSAMDIDPIKIMIPAAISASCAFMLPVATAPNAIIYGTEKVPIRSMISQGFKLNILGALVISTVATWWL